MAHESYNIANAVAVLQATQTFKRIASWCSAQLTRHNMSHEDTIENPFLKYATLFDTNDEVNAYYFAKALLRDSWKLRQYYADREVYGVILYDINCELNVLKHLRKKNG